MVICTPVCMIIDVQYFIYDIILIGDDEHLTLTLTICEEWNDGCLRGVHGGREHVQKKKLNTYWFFCKD